MRHFRNQLPFKFELSYRKDMFSAGLASSKPRTTSKHDGRSHHCRISRIGGAASHVQRTQLARWYFDYKNCVGTLCLLTLVQGHANESDWIALTILLSSAAWARVRYCQLWKTSPLFRLMRSFGSAIALEMLIWGVVFFTAAICHGVSKYLL